MLNKQTVARLCQAVALILLLPTMAQAQTTYKLDISGYDFEYVGGTDVHVSVETTITGTFTTKEEIESVLNSSVFYVSLIYEDEAVFTNSHGNSNWVLRLSGDATATLTIAPNVMTLDFTTPTENSSARLGSGNFDGNRGMTISQSKSATGFHASITIEYYDQQAGWAYPDNDELFVFPGQLSPGQEVPWREQTGGVTTDGNQIHFSGNPTGWRSNYVNSSQLSTVGVDDNFELSVSIATDPADSLWVVGLRSGGGATRWQTMQHSIRNTNGRLMVYEDGSWQTSGSQLAQGDVVSMHVESGVVEYRHNGDLILTSGYVGVQDFSVEAMFKYGAATLDLSLVPAREPLLPLTVSTPITQWVGAVGGVTTDGNTVMFSGTPIRWRSSVNSVPLSTLGVGDHFEVSWIIDDDPANNIWVVGLGYYTDSGNNWRDVDYAFRNSNGFLTIHKNGYFLRDVGTLSTGDVLSLYVSESLLEYRLNGETYYTMSLGAISFDDLYIDTAYKSGASALSFWLHTEGPPLPTGDIPITSWAGEVGGVSTPGDSIFYSGSPTGWNNSVNSALLSSLGATGDYTVSWTVSSDPESSLWVVGLGSTESDSNWQDIDVAIRNSNGWALVYFGKSYRQTLGPISEGDVIGLSVRPGFGSNGGVVYSINGQYIPGGGVPRHMPEVDIENLYIDTAFKNGAANLSGFTITNE